MRDGESTKHAAVTGRRAVPDGPTTATPYLIVDDARRAFDFYRRAFGAVEVMRLTDPAGKIVHAEMRIGDSRLMLAEEFPEMGLRGPLSLGGSPVVLALHVDDVDAVAERALAAGATIVLPVADQLYGARAGRLRDPFGHLWTVRMQIEDVSADEIRRRAAEWSRESPTPAPKEKR